MIKELYKNSCNKIIKLTEIYIDICNQLLETELGAQSHSYLLSYSAIFAVVARSLFGYIQILMQLNRHTYLKRREKQY